MKKPLLLAVTIALTLLGFVVAAEDKQEGKGKKVTNQVHSGYFESNKSGLKGDASYLYFTDKKGFDNIFGVAFVMGKKPNVLPKDVFDKFMVIAVIKRGNAIWTYDLEKVTNDDGTLYVQYRTKSKDGGTAKFASPMIVSVEKGKYKKIVFLENGKQVETKDVAK
jgi:hypothetical protein